MKAQLIINKNYRIGKIDPRIYGSFVEHIGRVVYNGIYDPEHETSDDMGFRGDVMELVRELDVPIVRYPGGNFISSYNWEDTVGDKSKRPVKLDAAWNSIETNEVGIDEFQEWAKRVNSEVMMAVNLGTRGADETRNVLEYCNLDSPTYWANKRRENGFDKPFKFKTWCLGNEMGGLGQICRKTPDDYGKLAVDCAKVMKMIDPSIELVLCGSSHRAMPRFGEWELTVLNHAYEWVDYLSIHQYYCPGDAPEEYFARSLVLDDFIKSVLAMCDSIKAIKSSGKKMMLSFDEWGIFGAGLVSRIEKPEKAPHLFECTYTFEDALVTSMMMMTLQNNCDRVKIACFAQLVNAIAPIMTENSGRAWRQTLYYPLMYASRNGRGEALKTVTYCDSYTSQKVGKVSYLESSVILNEEKREITVFAVNRSMEDDITLDAKFEDFEEVSLVSHTELYSDNLKATNSADEEAIRPTEVEITNSVILKKHSWNMLKYTY